MRYQPPFALPNEFALTVACCRWVYSDNGADEIRSLARSADWAAFLDTCRRHRVQGLIWRALTALTIDVPPPVAVALGADARRIAEHGLRAAAESRRLLDAFRNAGVPILFLKGLTLGKLAYGDPFIKMGWDVDVLVLPRDVAEAASLLAQNGFGVRLPRNADSVVAWHRSHKESVWQRSTGIVVELHSRVADQPELLPGLTAASAVQDVAIAEGVVLPTLANDELFAYLCVHGASSAWFRLKWLADIVALIHPRGSKSIERMHDRAEELGAGRAVAQALILAGWLFDTPVDQGLVPRLETRASRWLARSALKEMLCGEPTERILGTRAIHLTQLGLLPGWRYKWSELVRQVRSVGQSA